MDMMDKIMILLSSPGKLAKGVMHIFKQHQLHLREERWAQRLSSLLLVS